MSRKRRQTIAQEESERRLREAMEKPVNLSGVGEDPAVRALIDKFATASPADAMDILMALQRHIQGVSDEDQPEKREKIMVLKARASEVEAAEKAWNEDRVEFVQRIFDKNPSATGKAAEIIKAKAAKTYQDAMAKAHAQANERMLRLDHQIASGPREEILVTGHFETINDQTLLLPDQVKIMHRSFTLAPGRHIVPAVVADAYRNILALRAERDARRAAMSAADGSGLEFNEFARRQKEIDNQYGKSDFTGGLT